MTTKQGDAATNPYDIALGDEFILDPRVSGFNRTVSTRGIELTIPIW